MKVLIKREHFAKLLAYSKLCKSELGGFGRIVMTDNGNLEVTNIYLVKQRASGSTCELDADAIGLLEYESRNDSGELALWWHSHVDMGVSPSQQDIETMNKMGSNGRCLMLVINRKGETTAQYTFAGDKNKMIPAATITLTVEIVEAGVDKAAIKAEIAEKVLPLFDTTTRTFGQDDSGFDSSCSLANQWEQRWLENSNKRKEKANAKRGAKSFILPQSAFDIVESLYGIRLSSGYMFGQSKYHKGSIYICTEINGQYYSVAFDDYAEETNDLRQSVKQLVTK